MSKERKIIRLFAVTSILATNVFPVTPEIPQIVVQAATLQGKTGQVEEPGNQPEQKAVASESDESDKEASISRNETQSTQQAATNLESRSSVTGTWGTSAYSFDDVTGILTIQAGTLGESADSPWNQGKISSKSVKKIDLIGEVFAPSNSNRLFTGSTNMKNLVNLNEITGKLNTSNVTNMIGMFANNTSLTSVDVSDWDTSNVTDMSQIFDQCTLISRLDMSNWDTSNVVNMHWMFNNNNSLKEITLGEKSIFNSGTNLPEGEWLGKKTGVNFKTSADFLTNYDGSNPDTYLRISEMDCWGTSPYIFDETTGILTIYSGTLGESAASPWNQGAIAPTAIKKIELIGEVVAPENSAYLFSGKKVATQLVNLEELTGKLDTSQVTNFGYAFNNCSSLSQLDVSGWNTSQVTDLRATFNGCSSLSQLDVSGWNTSQVTDLVGTFSGCSSLSQLDVSGWNTSQVTHLIDAFSGCSSLSQLDVSKWDTDQVEDMTNMFKDCTSLSELTLGAKSLFDDTTALPEGAWVGQNSGVIYKNSTDFLTGYDGSNPDTFVRKEIKYWGTSPYIFDETTGTLTIHAGELDSSVGSPWNKGDLAAKDIKKIELVGNVVAPQDSTYLFSSLSEENRLTNLQEITGNLDTRNTTIFSYVFQGASSLTKVDSSNWDTSKFQKMYRTFKDCTSLTDLDVSNWDVSQVDDMSYTFDGCSSLTELDVSNWNIGNVTRLYGTFLNCTNLTKLDVSKWDTSKVTVLDSTFLFCESLTELDVSDWDTSQATTFKSLFNGCKSLESLNVSKWNTSQVTTMAATFNTCSKLKSIDVSGWDTSSVTDMTGMFYNSSNLSTIDVSNWDISQVKSLRATFLGCSSLTTLDVSKWTTSKVESMHTTFQGCTNLTNLTVSDWDTSQVTDMHSMFDGCENLKELDLNNWNTAQVKDLIHTFSNCSSLVELKVDNWDIGQVTDLYSTFNNCSSLLKLDLSSWKNTDKLENLSFAFEGCSSLADLNISSWDTSSLKTISRAFALCSSLTTLDLNNWDTGNVTEMGALFYNCSSLTDLNVSAWDTSSVTNMPSVFNGCTNLTTIDVSGWNTASATNMQNMIKGCDSLNELTLGKNSLFDTSVSLLEGIWTGEKTNIVYSNTNEFLTNYDGSQPDTFVRTDPSSMQYWGTSPYTFDETTGTLTVYSGTLEGGNGTPWYKNQESVDAKAIQKIELVGDVIAPTDSGYLFSNRSLDFKLDNLKSITGNLDISQTTSLYYTFEGCRSLSQIDVSNWDTSQVTTMQSTFNGCSSLSQLDVSGWNTSNVTTMYAAFWGCSSLSQLDVSGWNTSKVTTLETTFNGCSSLNQLDVGGWDVSQVTSLYHTFEGCSSLSQLDVSSWDVSQVTTLRSTFEDCSSLSQLEVDNWNTSNVTTMQSTFQSSGIKDLSIGNWNTSKVTSMRSMFWNCQNLVSLDFKNWDTSKVTNFDDMFGECPNLEKMTLGEKSIFDGTTDLSDSAWTGENTDVFYPNSNSFMTEYDGSQPDTFVKAKWGTSPYTFDETTGTLTVYPGELDSAAGSPWNKEDVAAKDVKKIELVGDVVAPADSSVLFSSSLQVNSLDNLKEIYGKLNTNHVTDMWNMFSGCTRLTSVDVSGWDTGQVTNMSGMFSNCRGLTSVDVSGWDTGQVTDMRNMFFGCTRLTSVDVSGWDTGQVTGMSEMFYNCSSLTSVDVSGWDTGQVTDMKYMFYICRGLTSVDVSGWDTGQVTDMRNMFFGCTRLTSVDVSGWDTGQVTDMMCMFGYCTSLTSLDLSNWDNGQVTEMSYVFDKCNKLATLVLGNNFSTTGKGDLHLPENRWIGTTNLIRFGSSVDFINNYDGSQPDTYVWDRTADLGLLIDLNDPMVIGQQDQLSWLIGHTAQSTQGRTAKAIKGTLSTAETIDLATEITVEEQDELGNFISMVNVPLVNEGTTNGVTTYSYSLSDLVSGHQYKLSLQGTPWNNTTVSSTPTFNYDLTYDANLELASGEMAIPQTLTVTSDRVIENGQLGFKDVPQELRFTTTKLSGDLNNQLIPRENKDWQMELADFRGTKAPSNTVSEPLRQDWEVAATANAFKDSTGQEIGYDALSIAYVDEQDQINVLNATETVLVQHEVVGEVPKDANTHSLSWAENEGFQAIVNDRNQIKTDETYQAELTFELRSAP